MSYNKKNIELKDILKYKTTIITGANGSGKTLALNNIKKQLSDKCKDYDIIFFEENRRFLFSGDEIQSIDLMNKLNIHSTFDIKEHIRRYYDMEDLFALDSIKKNGRINCGYLQVINYFYKLCLYDKSSTKILLVDDFDLNLHPLIVCPILRDLAIIFNIQHIIITTLKLSKYQDIVFKHSTNIIEL